MSTSGWVFEALEPRLLLSSDPLGVASDLAFSTDPDEKPDQLSLEYFNSLSDDSHSTTSVPSIPALEIEGLVCLGVGDDSTEIALEQAPTEIIFVDTSIDDFQTLLDGVQANTQTQYVVYGINAQEDGLDRVSQVLAEMDEVVAVHLVGHGNSGQLVLGNSTLSADTIASYETQLQGWQDALVQGGDLLIYGCDFAADDAGKAFAVELQDLLQLDIAASDDLTGSQELGGDWQLEFHAGEVSSAVAFSSNAQQNWEALLATVSVTTTSDVSDGDTSSISALIASQGDDNAISLREALEAANNTANGAEADVITFGLTGSNTIFISAELPAISDAVFIDGTSVNGYGSMPLIEIDGSLVSGSAITGLTLASSGSTISHLIINDMSGSGMIIYGHNNVIIGNYIGVSADGLNDEGNGLSGILVYEAGSNQIGGNGAGEGNVISGNSINGVSIYGKNSTNNQLLGNYVGTNAYGNGAIKNDVNGIYLYGGASDNFIGGATGNLISGNGSEGVEIEDNQSTGNEILGNLIGTNASGSAAIANEGYGVLIDGAKENVIGGSTAADRNLISGNGKDGIVVSGSTAQNNVIVGNYIGTLLDGNGALGNQGSGILVSADVENASGSAQKVIIGGADAGEGNLISGNQLDGVRLDSGVSDVYLYGNYIGTDSGGTYAIANGKNGIHAFDAVSNVTIGGSSTGEGNLISGNAEHGILVDASSGFVVQGNLIGTGADGSYGIANGKSGVVFTNGSSNNEVGGEADDQGNTIAFNSEVGVLVQDDDSNRNFIVGNQIFSNGDLGIDLGDDGVTANDSEDEDTGANNLQNYPILTTVEGGSTNTRIVGTINTSDTQNLLIIYAFVNVDIHFYASDAVDGSGNGEGQTYLGSTRVTTDNNGDASFDVTLVSASVAVGQYVTATATVSGSTSEFSSAVVVGPSPNNEATGSVAISGTPIEDSVLTANPSGIADADGISDEFNYQWLRDGVSIPDANGTSYTLTDDDVGSMITVIVSFTDDMGYEEGIESDPVGPVANINDAPQGSLSIDGTAEENQVLSVVDNLTDDDGMGTVSYQWQRDGVDISAATEETYTLTDADVGSVISVVASYTDDQGEDESVTSSATAVVTNVNDESQGSVTITGTAQEDEVLTASNSLTDDDGMGTVSYQWQRDGVNIVGATDATYTLTQADVGSAISVVASYTDDQGTDESVSSSATAAVINVNDEPQGSVTITGTAQEDEVLTASNTITDDDGVGSVNYQWQRDGVDIVGATDTTYTLTDADVGSTISVIASYTDDQGTDESVSSSATAVVANVNDAPQGTVTITGTAQEDEELTASNTITDADGVGTVSYQWQRDGVDIAGATDGTYTLTQADVGTAISVVASYTDDQGVDESVSSTATAVVANVNDDPQGSVTITGIAQEDEVLTASNSLTDEDGVGTVSYQWQRDGVDIVGATDTTYTLTDADVGSAISVVASYTDDQGTDESVSSSATAVVANVNDEPQGTVTITGTVQEDEELTASNTITDNDGVGTVSYQWQRDGVDIVGATNTTYTLTQADVGSTISVVASYTDDQGADESVSSSATAVVTNVNDDPQGAVTITGIAQEDEVLTASNSLTDEDGVGTVSYQWQRDGVDIVGATDATYTLTQADVGSAISVVASYTDDQGVDESVSSSATAAVTNVNDDPQGAVTITGIAQEDEVLTASNSLTDEDGVGTVSYQWQRDGVDIVGATDTTYTLTDADVGTAISVVASYTDDQGTDESVSSSATAVVANINDAPQGTVTISGTAQEDEELTASNTITDNDGVGTVSYQWQRDGVDIVGATDTTYILTDADVGSTIKVVASYTDDQGENESVSSAATAAVINVNDDPQGSVTITGTAQEDEVLTASNTITDDDGVGSVNYQWQRDGVDIVGATNTTYTLTQADVGSTISVVASYSDDQGTDESVSSSATAVVANVNDDPQGSVTITGTAQEDEVLTASNTITDSDGVGTVSYQWQRNGVDIAGASDTTYTLTQADVGSTISVVASYTDAQGADESVSSSATAAVTNVNDDPQGSVTITGTAQEDEELTASNTITDDDGVGTVSYQWQRDGVDIVGATDTTYTLTDADVGSTISVIASYTDDQGEGESVASNATAVVTNVNDAPQGTVTITGTVQEDEELTASNTITDNDGVGTVSYQWQRDGVDIVGATNTTYFLADADVGSTISVVASYTDDQGTDESVSSGATAVVANVNDEPQGSVTITGTAQEDEELTASNTITDDDGVGTVSYQWQRDGADIAGATDTTYILTDADVGSTISVIANYTDDQGEDESVSSDATAVVTNVNDEPQGSVTVTGTVQEDEVLTASNNINDNDGIGEVSYQWQRDGVDISGATESSYTLTDDDVGSTISVVANYTDGRGEQETVESVATARVENLNDNPQGTVSISGVALQGQKLSVTNNLLDDDGLGTFSYQWQRDGVDIDGANSSTYRLTADDVGDTISVLLSYTDGQGTLEQVSSSSTDTVQPLILIDQETIVAPEPSEPVVETPVSVEEPGTIEQSEPGASQEEAEESIEEESASDEQAAEQASDQASQMDQPLILDGLNEGVNLSGLVNVTNNGLDLGINQPNENKFTALSLSSALNQPQFLDSLYSRTSLMESNVPGLSDSLKLVTTPDYLDSMSSIQQAIDQELEFSSALLGSSTALTAGFSVGYAIWLIRSGVIVSSVLSSLPAWRFVDPLPILQGLGEGGDDQESLQSMVSATDDADTSKQVDARD